MVVFLIDKLYFYLFVSLFGSVDLYQQLVSIPLLYIKCSLMTLILNLTLYALFAFFFLTFNM
jgi:hypothetical protein